MLMWCTPRCTPRKDMFRTSLGRTRRLRVFVIGSGATREIRGVTEFEMPAARSSTAWDFPQERGTGHGWPLFSARRKRRKAGYDLDRRSSDAATLRRSSGAVNLGRYGVRDAARPTYVITG